MVHPALPSLSPKSCVQVQAGNQPAPGLLSPAPSSVPGCHQGHLLGLTDGSEKPIKCLLLPVICYRKAARLTRAGSSPHNWREFSRHPVLCVAALALLGPSLPSHGLFSPPSEADLISTLSFCPPCHVSFPRSSQEPQSQQASAPSFSSPERCWDSIAVPGGGRHGPATY